MYIADPKIIDECVRFCNLVKYGQIKPLPKKGFYYNYPFSIAGNNFIVSSASVVGSLYHGSLCFVEEIQNKPFIPTLSCEEYCPGTTIGRFTDQYSLALVVSRYLSGDNDVVFPVDYKLDIENVKLMWVEPYSDEASVYLRGKEVGLDLVKKINDVLGDAIEADYKRYFEFRSYFTLIVKSPADKDAILNDPENGLVDMIEYNTPWVEYSPGLFVTSGVANTP